MTTSGSTRFVLEVEGPSSSQFPYQSSVVFVTGDALGSYLVLSTITGYLLAYHDVTGTQVWTQRVGYQPGTPAVSSAGVITLGDEAGLGAYSRRGAQLWRHSATVEIIAGTAITKAGLVISFSSDSGGWLSGRWISNGTLVWSTTPSSPVAAIALSADETLVVVATSSFLSAFRTTNAHVVWEVDTGSNYQDFCIGNDGIAYFGSSFYVNVSNGNATGTPVYRSGSHFCAISATNVLYEAFSNSVSAWQTAGMQQLWMDTLSITMSGAPAIGADGTVYVVGTLNEFASIYALRGTTGGVVWRYDVPVRSHATNGALSIGPDGSVYARVDTYFQQSQVYAFQAAPAMPTSTASSTRTATCSPSVFPSSSIKASITSSPSFSRTPQATSSNSRQPIPQPASLSSAAQAGIGVGTTAAVVLVAGAALRCCRQTKGSGQSVRGSLASDSVSLLPPALPHREGQGVVMRTSRGYGTANTQDFRPPTAPTVEQLGQPEGLPGEDPLSGLGIGTHDAHIYYTGSAADTLPPRASGMADVDPTGPR